MSSIVKKKNVSLGASLSNNNQILIYISFLFRVQTSYWQYNGWENWIISLLVIRSDQWSLDGAITSSNYGVIKHQCQGKFNSISLNLLSLQTLSFKSCQHPFSHFLNVLLSQPLFKLDKFSDSFLRTKRTSPLESLTRIHYLNLTIILI